MYDIDFLLYMGDIPAYDTDDEFRAFLWDMDQFVKIHHYRLNLH